MDIFPRYPKNPILSDERKSVQNPFFHLLDQETEIVMKTSGRIYTYLV